MEKEKVNRLRSYLIFWLHVVFIVMWLTSPFWLYWPLLIVLSILLYLQSTLLGYCVVTKWQFGTGEKSFWVHYLGKLGLNVRREQVTYYTHVFLIVSPILGWVWQTRMW